MITVAQIIVTLILNMIALTYGTITLISNMITGFAEKIT